MQTYVVGGAVRDTLMGKTPKDVDYVIVGATSVDIATLKRDGWKQVGADFPVFLNPITGDEYALARIERKVGDGYNGFECETEGVTLEDDLFRRDLTMNSVAYDLNSATYYDPYGGIADIENKVIRHTSEAFKEDPVRVLRVARFAARYSDFTIHESTYELLRSMVKAGELNHLTRERVHAEVMKALSEKDHHIFFNVLKKIGALHVLFEDVLYWMERYEGTANWCSEDLDLDQRFAFYFERATEEQLRKWTATVDQIKLIKKMKVIYSSFNSDLSYIMYIKEAEDVLDVVTNLNATRDIAGIKYVFDVIRSALSSSRALKIITTTTTYLAQAMIEDCANAINTIDNIKLLEGVDKKDIKDTVMKEKIKMVNHVLWTRYYNRE